MVSLRSLLLLAAVLSVALAATSNLPPRWGGLQATPRPPQPPPPPAMVPPPPQNTTVPNPITNTVTQLVALIAPKVQAKVYTLLANVGRAIAGAMVATFRTGFKVPLAATFTPLDKADSTLGFALDEPEYYYPPGYTGEEEALRSPEIITVDEEATERKLS